MSDQLLPCVFCCEPGVLVPCGPEWGVRPYHEPGCTAERSCRSSLHQTPGGAVAEWNRERGFCGPPEPPPPPPPPPELVGRIRHGILLSISEAELAGMSAERIAALFEGLARAIRAAKREEATDAE